MGFSIDKAFLHDLRTLTSLARLVPRARARPDAGAVLATTQPQPELEASLRGTAIGAQPPSVPLQLHDFDTIVTALPQEGSNPIEVALQRSVTEGLEPFERLKSMLALLTAASIVASVVGSIVLARRITQPLAALTRFASARPRRRLPRRAGAQTQRRDRCAVGQLQSHAGWHRSAPGGDPAPRLRRHRDRAAEPGDVQHPADAKRSSTIAATGEPTSPCC